MKSFKSLLVTGAVLFSLTPSVAYAFPKAPFDALALTLKSEVQLDSSYDFNGIVKLSNCSGSVIRFSGMPDAAKAVVMTNGHCVSNGMFGGMVKPGEVIYNRALNRSMKVYNNGQKLIPVNATKVLYATMTDTDVAYYELKETYNDLKARGVDSFILDGDRPSLGLPIDIVSGYWDRGYRCNIDAFIFVLKEADYTMKDSIRYSATGCNTIGGTSGSPIIESGTRTVIGINNTGNESGKKCTMNNPCEVDESGRIEVKAKASYGQQTYPVYSCLTADFRIDLKKEGCTLYQN
ncbi:MAG: hypothetical protein L6Q33_12680 [Bacteriovoracaceae bacterium]|nr:hypothetical protein [Bacteriovoracaceae bacterium]